MPTFRLSVGIKKYWTQSVCCGGSLCSFLSEASGQAVFCCDGKLAAVANLVQITKLHQPGKARGILPWQQKEKGATSAASLFVHDVKENMHN